MVVATTGSGEVALWRSDNHLVIKDRDDNGDISPSNSSKRTARSMPLAAASRGLGLGMNQSR